MSVFRYLGLPFFATARDTRRRCSLARHHIGVIELLLNLLVGAIQQRLTLPSALLGGKPSAPNSIDVLTGLILKGLCNHESLVDGRRGKFRRELLTELRVQGALGVRKAEFAFE
jgi:hypothetical protein